MADDAGVEKPYVRNRLLWPSLADLRDARPRLVVVVVCGTLRRRLRHLHLLFLKESRR